MRCVQAHEQHHPVLRRFYAIPNGGHRSKAVAAKMRAEGVRAGVPDYCMPASDGVHHALYIELKRPKGKPSEDQEQWQIELQKLGNKAIVAIGWWMAWTELARYLMVPTMPLWSAYIERDLSDPACNPRARPRLTPVKASGRSGVQRQARTVTSVSGTTPE